jgi:hypothetical protein
LKGNKELRKCLGILDLSLEWASKEANKTGLKESLNRELDKIVSKYTA